VAFSNHCWDNNQAGEEAMKRTAAASATREGKRADAAAPAAVARETTYICWAKRESLL
jgi:hypothetical protein